MTNAAPLKGLTVIAVEQAVAAPFCTARLADAGARVIKIERPEGDFARRYDDVAKGQSSYFVWLNRGKESLVLDLASEAGRAELAELIAGADVVVQNLRTGAMARMGFAPEDLRKRFPKLIVCSISGYGEDGPYAGRKAYDLLVQAESGLCSITGGPSEPSRVGVSVADIATGATAHAAVLEALIGRGVTGEGADIRVSLFDVLADWLTVPLLHQEGGKPPRRIGLAHPSIAPYGVYQTRDGAPVLISIQSEREWAKFCEVFLEAPETPRDERFESNVARVRNRVATDAMVGARFAELDKDDALALLDRADVAFGLVNDMAGLAAHPHLRRISVETPEGRVSYPAPAPIVMGAARRYGPVPSIGEAGAGPDGRQEE